MSKVKKALLIATYTLILCCIVGIAICYIVIPDRTKVAMDTLIGYLNTPLGIVGGTTITVGFIGAIVYKLITVAHQKTIEQKYNEAKLCADEQKEKAKEYYELALKEKEQTMAMLSAYDERLDQQANQIVVVCQTIPNKKVNDLVSEFTEKTLEQKQELKQELESLDNDFASAMDKEDKVKKLENKVEELIKKFEGMVESYGEKKETTND